MTDIQARPERLISRLRVSSLEETGPRLTVSRQPKGPDGSKGFQSSARQPRQPGVIPEWLSRSRKKEKSWVPKNDVQKLKMAKVLN